MPVIYIYIYIHSIHIVRVPHGHTHMVRWIATSLAEKFIAEWSWIYNIILSCCYCLAWARFIAGFKKLIWFVCTCHLAWQKAHHWITIVSLSPCLAEKFIAEWSWIDNIIITSLRQRFIAEFKVCFVDMGLWTVLSWDNTFIAECVHTYIYILYIYISIYI